MSAVGNITVSGTILTTGLPSGGGGSVRIQSDTGVCRFTPGSTVRARGGYVLDAADKTGGGGGGGRISVDCAFVMPNADMVDGSGAWGGTSTASPDECGGSGAVHIQGVWINASVPEDWQQHISTGSNVIITSAPPGCRFTAATSAPATALSWGTGHHTPDIRVLQGSRASLHPRSFANTASLGVGVRSVLVEASAALLDEAVSLSCQTEFVIAGNLTVGSASAFQGQVQAQELVLQVAPRGPCLGLSVLVHSCVID